MHKPQCPRFRCRINKISRGVGVGRGIALTLSFDCYCCEMYNSTDAVQGAVERCRVTYVTDTELYGQVCESRSGFGGVSDQGANFPSALCKFGTGGLANEAGGAGNQDRFFQQIADRVGLLGNRRCGSLCFQPRRIENLISCCDRRSFARAWSVPISARSKEKCRMSAEDGPNLRLRW